MTLKNRSWHLLEWVCEIKCSIQNSIQILSLTERFISLTRYAWRRLEVTSAETLCDTQDEKNGPNNSYFYLRSYFHTVSADVIFSDLFGYILSNSGIRCSLLSFLQPQSGSSLKQFVIVLLLLLLMLRMDYQPSEDCHLELIFLCNFVCGTMVMTDEEHRILTF